MGTLGNMEHRSTISTATIEIQANRDMVADTKVTAAEPLLEGSIVSMMTAVMQLSIAMPMHNRI